MTSTINTRRMVLCAVFCALIVVMTVVPYTGYITYAPALIEITTLHIVVILGAMFTGPKYGAVIGLVWGLTCLARAFAMPTPVNVVFQNPLVSVLPRLLVGLVAGLVFDAMSKRIKLKPVNCIVTAVVGTLTNTLLVLPLFYIFYDVVYPGEITSVAQAFKMMFSVIISVNFLIEIVAAIIIIPILYTAITASRKK